jgi:hypothetical protein
LAALLLAGFAVASSAGAVPDSLLHTGNGSIKQAQQSSDVASSGHASKGPFATAAVQQQATAALQHSGNGHAGAGAGPQLMPSADFALFAQLHLHNPAPASRQLQQQHSATLQHPVIESFPSFSKRHSSGLQQELLQQAADEAAAAFEAAAEGQTPSETTSSMLQHAADRAPAGAAAGSACLQVQPAASSEASPASSSDAALLLSSSGSPLQQQGWQHQQQQGQQQHQHARKVSLLSQQIACARSRGSAGDAQYEAAGYERGVGSTHHHASEFWCYMQVGGSRMEFGPSCGVAGIKSSMSGVVLTLSQPAAVQTC